MTANVVFPPAAATPKKLQYLLEPPVQVEVAGRRGDNVTLPCIIRIKPNHYKIKWTKLDPEHLGQQNIIMISNANAFKPYGHVGQRASLLRAHTMDASLMLRKLELSDDGRYQCELINGIEDERVVITLRIEGNQKLPQTSVDNVESFYFGRFESTNVGHIFSVLKYGTNIIFLIFCVFFLS